MPLARLCSPPRQQRPCADTPDTTANSVADMKTLEFIRGDLNFDLLVANTVADILPMLQKAAAAVPEEQKEMPAVIADRL